MQVFGVDNSIGFVEIPSSTCVVQHYLLKSGIKSELLCEIKNIFIADVFVMEQN